jgi:hypothetical protein
VRGWYARLSVVDALMDSNIWWSGPLALFALRFLYVEAVFARAEAKGNALVFRVAGGLRLLFGAGVIGTTVGIILSLGRESVWVIVGSAGILAAMCFYWPTVIVITGERITHNSWWGRSIRIGWPDVTGIERRAGGELNVFGRNGEMIAFKRYHVDPRRFEAEVLKRANLNSVIDASGPPTMRF